MQSYYIWTIGCQMNVADSERLESGLEQMGLGKASHAQDADVVVLNSCVVRQSAEDKVVGMLGHLKPLKRQNREKVIALMGLHGRAEDRYPAGAVPSSGRVHAPSAVRSPP